jgi:hypothetical protein
MSSQSTRRDRGALEVTRSRIFELGRRDEGLDRHGGGARAHLRSQRLETASVGQDSLSNIHLKLCGS